MLYTLLFPALRDIALEAAGTSLEALLSTVGVGVDWALVNQPVVDWARDYTLQLSTSLTDVSNKFVTDEITAWMESGQPIGALIDSLAPMFGPTRADMIATTEVTRAYAEGNTATWKASGVVTARRWMTAEDELVCPICGDLDGEEAGFDEQFGNEYDGPPAHPRCRCYIQPVVRESND